MHDAGPLVFGTRRLKIIDLAGGHQPLSNEDDTVWVAFNGEIFNHEARREVLSRDGHVFRTRCDTEVIVHEWEEHGADCVDKLHGQFGFAVWDRRTRTLMLARDRLGIKPIYYAWSGTRLVFASEIKAILATGLVTPEVDLHSLHHYVGYEFVPAPATMFRGIRKLPAGHRLLVSNGEMAVEQYWDVDFAPADVSESECIRSIRQLLGEAVEKRLMAEVPLGVFLSGGLDSTAVLAYACQATDRRLPTFTIGYADESFSEWEHARRAARHYGTDHHEIVIEPITPELIEAAVWHLDEPMTDLSSIPFHLLCRRARAHATVCLSGEGGDEVFVGYDRFIASKIEQAAYRRIPRALRRGPWSSRSSRVCRIGPGRKGRSTCSSASWKVHRCPPRAVTCAGSTSRATRRIDGCSRRPFWRRSLPTRSSPSGVTRRAPPPPIAWGASATSISGSPCRTRS